MRQEERTRGLRGEIAQTVDMLRRGDILDGIGGGGLPRPGRVMSVEPVDENYLRVKCRVWRPAGLVDAQIDIERGTEIWFRPPR